MNAEITLGRASSVWKRVRSRPLLYIALFAVCVSFLVRVAFLEAKNQADALANSRYVFSSLVTLGDPTTVFRYHFSRSASSNPNESSDDLSAPLTKGSSSYLQIDTAQYDGNCTSLTPQKTIEIAVVAPAFSVGALDSERRSVEDLTKQYCSLQTKTPVQRQPWSWVIVPRDSGDQLVVLRTAAKDAQGHELSSGVVRIPMVVQDPPDMAVLIGVVSSIVGIVAAIVGFFDHKRNKPPEPS